MRSEFSGGVRLRGRQHFVKMVFTEAACSSVATASSAGNQGSVVLSTPIREITLLPLHLMQRSGRPIGGLRSPVPGRMEDTAETSY